MFKSINPLNHHRLLFYRSQKYFSVQYSKIVNKFVVSKSPSFQDKYAIFAQPQFTIGQFFAKVKQLYPNKNIGITTISKDLWSLGYKVDPQKQQKQFQQIKDVPCIQALLINRLKIFEKNQQNVATRIFGIKIAEHNMTDKINIPEHIQQGVVNLNAEWAQKRMTVAQALSFNNISKPPQVQQVLSQPTSQLIKNTDQASELTKQQQNALQQSLLKLIRIQKFKTKIGPYLPRVNKIMKIIVALMSVNWAFLFVLTYCGFGGWNVGEPVSYITNLGVDLVAMLGLFESNRFFTQQKEADKDAIERAVNLPANENMAKWRVAYLIRKSLL